MVTLDTGLIIGIGVDVVLAIVVGVLIYWWRVKVNNRKRLDRISKFKDSQRTRTTSIANTDESLGGHEDTKINAVLPVQRGTSDSGISVGAKDSLSGDAERVEGNFAFLSTFSQQESVKNTNSPNVNKDSPMRRSRVTFSDTDNEEEEEEVQEPPEPVEYPQRDSERVVSNPLATSLTHQNPGEAGDVAVSTYYTYIDPNDVKDDETIVQENVARQNSYVSVIPPPIVDQGEANLIDSEILPSPPPSIGSGSGIMVDNPAYDADSDDEYGERMGHGYETRSASMNFKDEEYIRLYNTEMEISTDIV